MKLRFIVIDDQKGIRYIFREYLTELGHEVVCAEHPLAEPICNKTSCYNKYACADGYFVDFSMPYMTGIAFLENSLKRGCKVPLENMVLMSGNFTQWAHEKAEELGITLKNKPIQLSEIGALIEEMQNRIKPNRKLAELPTPGTTSFLHEDSPLENDSKIPTPANPS